MSEEHNNLNKDVSNLKADSTIKKANIENIALTVTNDINRWYTDRYTQKLESRLETNVEQEDTDGINTNVDTSEGIQTNLNNDEDVQQEENSNNINTRVNNPESQNNNTNSNNSDNTNNGEDVSNLKYNQNNEKKQNSKIKTKVTDLQEVDGETQGNNSKDKNNKIQTRINRTKKSSKVISGAIKTKQVTNRTIKSIARRGKQIQTASEGNIGENFTSNIKDTSKRTVGKVADLTTRKVRQKIRGKIAQITVKLTKAVFKLLMQLLKALLSLLVKILPAIVVVLVLFILILAIGAVAGGSVSDIFGNFAKDSTLNSYVEYMDNVDSELSETVDWKSVCAVIHCLDMDIQYDEAEQYLLKEFKNANLYRSNSKVTDYIDWLNKNYSVVTTFYEKKGSHTAGTIISEEDVDIMKELYNSDEFMKLIDEKRKSSVNTGTVGGSTGSGTTEGKLSYPTSYRTISAGYPNYNSGKYHGGIDFPCPTGTSICASADGTVISAKELNYSYGHYIIIDHGNGVATLYAHNSKLLVGVGDKVTRGQEIAKSGSTGNSTGPHCHYEVRVNGTRVNPLNYLE